MENFSFIFLKGQYNKIEKEAYKRIYTNVLNAIKTENPEALL